MTDLEILENVINTLNNIQVPAALTKGIAIPIYNAVVDLQALHDAIVKQIREAQAKKEQKEPEVEIGEPQFVGEDEPLPEGAENAEPIALFPESGNNPRP